MSFCSTTLSNSDCSELSTPRPRVAVISGVTGQDGSYLTEFLLKKGYNVHGLMRRTSHVPTERIEHLLKNTHLILHYCDVTDSQNIYETFRKIEHMEQHAPDEIYNLAAQSHVQVSFSMPAYTAQADGLGTLYMLTAIKDLQWLDKTKFYQASTSELFGSSPPPQNETTPFHPRSPYSVAKLYAYWSVINFRESYNMFAVNGILFNHESERRGIIFVTRKITRAVGEYYRNNYNMPNEKILTLGNIDSKRDWGYAKDYVEAMWIMLQQDKPLDLVIGTGESHSVREFVEESFKSLPLPKQIKWVGHGLDEVGIIDDKVVVSIDAKYFRNAEVENLLADPTKSEEILKWKPKTKFHDLVKIMIHHDLHTQRHVY